MQEVTMAGICTFIVCMFSNMVVGAINIREIRKCVSPGLQKAQLFHCWLHYSSSVLCIILHILTTITICLFPFSPATSLLHTRVRSVQFHGKYIYYDFVSGPII